MRIYNANASGHVFARIADYLVRTEEGRELALTSGLHEVSVLMSFHYYKAQRARDIAALFAPLKANIFCDSGAFSGANIGVPIKLGEYSKWVHANAEQLAIVANLDVIGDPEKTKRNQAALESDGLTPIPVFHVGSDFKHLDEILERYDYFALGGMVPYLFSDTSHMHRWVRQVFERIAQRRPGVKVHGFGCTTWTLMSAFPWYSVDSSSSIAGIRHGQVNLFDAQLPGIVTFPLPWSSKKGAQGAFTHHRLIREYGFPMSCLLDRKRYSYAKVGGLGMAAMSRAEAWLSQHHEAQHGKASSEDG